MVFKPRESRQKFSVNQRGSVPCVLHLLKHCCFFKIWHRNTDALMRDIANERDI